MTIHIESPYTEAKPLPSSKAIRLPERIGSPWRSLLFYGDAGVVTFVSIVTLNGGGSRIAAAILVAAILCVTFWQCGFYKRSYAVHAYDEIYYAFTGVAIAAVPVFLILDVGDISALSVLIALIFCVVGTSAVHMRLHIERRGSISVRAGLASITPGAWLDRESASYRYGKRCFDLVVGSTALVLLLPIMLAAAIAIYVESGRPVLFRQERVGEAGAIFRIFKFRTMVRDAGAAWAQPGDSRITPVGAFLRRASIDELPQLFNVLQGDMSIVGPRPEMREFAQRFSVELPNYDQRHIVRPGITGWAQLYQKRNLQPGDMASILPYDLFYIEHASVVLDFTLLLKTASEVLSHSAV